MPSAKAIPWNMAETGVSSPVSPAPSSLITALVANAAAEALDHTQRPFQPASGWINATEPSGFNLYPQPVGTQVPPVFWHSSGLLLASTDSTPLPALFKYRQGSSGEDVLSP